MKRIGLLGGSFNPPHLGHLLMAEHLHCFAACDEVWLLVTPHNPFKDPNGYASLEDRMKMCELMAQELPWLKVSDIEKEFGCTRTAETLENLRRQFPDDQFVWSMGGDNLLEFHRWEGWDSIISHHPVVVFDRPGAADAANAPALAIARKDGFIIDDATQIIDGAKGFIFCSNETLNISSTDIRKALRANPHNCPNGIKVEVYHFIKEKKLFRDAAQTAAPHNGAAQKLP